MWRIPVFLVGVVLSFFCLALIFATLVDAGLTWMAVIVLTLGASSFALLIFPTLNWVVEGRWGGFYRRR